MNKRRGLAGSDSVGPLCRFAGNGSGGGRVLRRAALRARRVRRGRVPEPRHRPAEGQDARRERHPLRLAGPAGLPAAGRRRLRRRHQLHHRRLGLRRRTRSRSVFIRFMF